MQSQSFDVWTVPDNVRVEPTEGRIIDANPALFSDAFQGNLRVRNSIWDSSSHKISVKGARDEIIAFQIVVQRLTESPLEGVEITFSSLNGPDGASIASSDFDLYKEWYVRVREPSEGNYTLGRGWYPDALLPCHDFKGNQYPSSYIHPFDIPDLMNKIGPRHRYQAMWVDLYIPRDTPPGEFSGQVSIRTAQQEIQLDLSLQVWDFELPAESHLAGNIHSNTNLHTLPEELQLRYYQLIRRHRMALGVLGYAPEITVSGTEVRFDWKDYDRRLGKYLDGSAFTERYGYRGPGSGVPIELLVLPFDAYPINLYKYKHDVGAGLPVGKEFKFLRPWPIPVPTEGIDSQYEEVWKNAYRGFYQHLQEKKWTRTRPVVFFLSLDESYDPEFYEQMALHGRLLDESGVESFDFRIDGGYPPEAMSKISRYVDIAILAAGGFNPGRVEKLRSQGIEDWIYMAAGNIDQAVSNGRALSWVCWKFGISSWTLWELDFNSLRAYIDPTSYVSATGRIHNGHGMLVYRGETMGLDEPVASIRLKMMRRGAQDYEYLWLLSREPDMKKRAAEIVDSIIRNPLGTGASWGSPGMWSHDSEEWERARIALGHLVEEASESER